MSEASEQWRGRIDPPAVLAAFGHDTYELGLDYVRRGNVLRVQFTGGLALAQVQGSRPRPYEVMLRHTPALRGVCTCRFGRDCQHVAALALTLCRAPDLAAPAPPWERLLDRVLGADEQHVPPPLGLQLDVVRDLGEVRLTLRPVTLGRRGDWVRTGVGWRDLEYSYIGPFAHHPGRSPLLALRDQVRRGAPYGWNDAALDLGKGGPGGWPLLDAACRAGVRLVYGKQGSARIGPPVGLTIDLTRPAPGAPIELAPRLALLDDGAALGAAAQDEQRELLEHAALFGDPPVGAYRALEDRLVVWPLDARTEPTVLDLLRSTDPVRIPEQELGRFRSGYLGRLRQLAPVVSHDASVELPPDLRPELVARVRFGPEHRAELDWLFRYGEPGSGWEVALDEPIGEVAAGVDLGARETDRGLPVRLPADEARLVEGPDWTDPRLASLLRHGLPQLAPHAELAGLETADLVLRALPALGEAGVVVETDGEVADYRESAGEPLVELDIVDTPDRDWFDLTITLTVGGVPIPMLHLVRALSLGEDTLILDDGLIVRLAGPRIDELRQLLASARELGEPELGTLRVSASQVGVWEELRSLGIVRAESDRWRATVTALLDGVDDAPTALPDGLVATLRTYQRDGFAWLDRLWRLGLGGVLADDMGLGKTVQALAAVQAARERGVVEPVLIVAPTSVVAGWAAEARRFTPDLRVVTVTATEKRRGVSLAEIAGDVDVVITSYALLRLEGADYAALRWSAMLCDEAQQVKNHRSKGYRAIREVPAPVRFVITGTPLENNLMELWALVSIAAPGLFPDPEVFTEAYRTPIERRGDREALAALRRRLRPFLLRRTKQLVAADLPAKQEQTLHLELDPRHRRSYDVRLARERQKVLKLLDDLDANRFEILRSLTVLRQLALSPGLVGDDTDHDQPRAEHPLSVKIDSLVDHLLQLAAEGHRALVFSQFTRFLTMISTRLTAAGIGHGYLDGSTPAARRGEILDAFRSGDDPAMLISLKAGGFGINLVEADYVFLMDPWWNPAAEAQAIDRTHRIGQQRPVHVYRLIAADTIEDKVAALQERKRALFAKIMDADPMTGSADLTADDLRELFS